jgi:hypothetical protein
VIAILAGACQQSGNGGSQEIAFNTAQGDVDSITPEYVAGLSVDDGERAWDRLGKEIDARISKACLNEQEQGCRRKATLAAFGNDPILDRHCPLVGYNECVLVGSEIVAILRAVNADPEAEIDWSDFGKSFGRAEDLMDAHVEGLCAPDKARDSSPCTTMRRIEAFGGSAEAAKRCAEQRVADRYLCSANVRAAYLYGQALKTLPK